MVGNILLIFSITEKGLKLWAQKQKSKKQYAICVTGIPVNRRFELLGFDNINLKQQAVQCHVTYHLHFV